MRPLITLSARELAARLRDGTALVVAFVAPAVMAALLSFALGGDSGALDVTLGVASPDRDPVADRFVREIEHRKDLSGAVHIERFVSSTTADRALADGDVGAVVRFPAGFSELLSEANPARITVVSAPGSPIAGIVARSAAERLVSVTNGRVLAEQVSRRSGVPDSQVATHVDRVSAAAPALRLADDDAGASSGGAAYYGPAMALLFAFFVAGTSMRGLLTERRVGLVDRMAAMSVPQWLVITSKAAVGLLLAMASMCVTWLSSVSLFGVTWGPPGTVLLILAADAFAAVAVMGLIASLARTDAQANGYTTLVAFVFAMVGGSFIPLYQLPELLRDAALVTPNGLAMHAFAGDVLPPLLGLVGVGLACVALAATRFRKGVPA